MSAPFDPTPEEMQERGDHLAAMERNHFMRNSGMLDDAQLDEFLASSCITGASHESKFIGFQVVFGFDTTGRDFVAIKDLAGQGAHIVFVADQ
ncbi:hypothetical protein [Noviherbaspirillum sedimenti]|uniref:Uncharacterized protein n=1 Tax=Noviherbaspirillum sedimenti TaxID=2320865 RepID=A0A3A3G7J2_9BURK|nr:hypothetical protein [Noviherbaspirillum sedimenti]RJG02522.1 hypothetical protein D3878_13840 [Noviherbaspirillum sedimenti]